MVKTNSVEEFNDFLDLVVYLSSNKSREEKIAVLKLARNDELINFDEACELIFRFIDE